MLWLSSYPLQGPAPERRRLSIRRPRFGLPILVVVLFALASASRSAGQETRRETGDDEASRRGVIWRQHRLERFEEIEPKTLSKSARFLRWLEKELGEPVPSTGVTAIAESLQLRSNNMTDVGFLDYRDYLFPRVGSIRDGAGLSAGVRFFRRSWGLGLDTELTGAVSVNGYQFYELRLGRVSTVRVPEDLRGRALRNPPNAFFAYADVRYGDFRDEDFFGLGADSRLEAETTFRTEEAAYSGVTGYHIDSHWTIGVRGGLSQIDVREGASNPIRNEPPFGVLAPSRLDQNADFLEVAASVFADYRDVPGNPHQGIAGSFSVARFDDTLTDRFRFTRYAGQARGFVPLGSSQRTLLLSFLLSSDVVDNGKEVPFYLQQTLGGSRTLRGFKDRRFRGKNLLHMTAEYRWEPALFWELAAFWDGGKVFQDFDEGFNLEDLESSVGVNTRFKTAESVVLRFGVAFSREGARFHAGFGTTF